MTKAEHLKRWLATAQKSEKDATTTRESVGTKENRGTAVQPETEEADNWEMVMDLVQLAFWEGDLTEEATWQVVVLIPKGKEDYQGIGIVEVMWKVPQSPKLPQPESRAEHTDFTTVQPGTAPGDKHPHFCAAVPGGQLGAYGGQDRVGGDATT